MSREKRSEVWQEISFKDIQSFGRVLKAIGTLCETQPHRVLTALSLADSDTVEHADHDGHDESRELDSLDLFDLALNRSRAGLTEALSQYDAQQLRYLIRKHRLGSIKSSSTQKLLDHLVDQLAKRSVDVFKAHK